MHFSKLVALFACTLPATLASVIGERDAAAGENWYNIADSKYGDVYSNVSPQKRETQWYKIVHNEHGGVDSTVPPPTKRDSIEVLEVKREHKQVCQQLMYCPNGTGPANNSATGHSVVSQTEGYNISKVMAYWDFLLAHPADDNEQGLVDRELMERAWSDIFARCVLCMAQCYGQLRYNFDGRPILELLNHCFFPWCANLGYCVGSLTQQKYRREFNSNFAPQDLVDAAAEQLYIDYNGGQ